jgi:transcriptional regulator with XRE-family HTH domain
MKSAEKEKAIRLRKEGKTYSEILAEIPIAKSTLSDWLKSVQLAKPQKQRLTKKRKDAALRGAKARHQTRVSEMKLFERDGIIEVGTISTRELWLIGVALYWAEGSKQYEHSPSTGVVFNNSDVRMIRFFLRWLEQMKVPTSSTCFELYVHETRKSDTLAFKRWWARELGIPVSRLDKVYFKKGNPKTKRKNVGDLYHGLIRIRVNSSTALNRKIGGWVHGIVA